MDNLLDLIIVGSGPAGCTASIYASRYKMSNLVLGKTKGGTISYAHNIENYPGCNGIAGVELMEKVENHVKTLGAEIIYDPVNKINKKDDYFQVMTASGKQYLAKTVIAATGTERKKLNISGESQLQGKGVSYCVTCDAPLFRGKTVALVGGGDAACSGAVHLAEFTKKIYLIYRGDALKAEPFWISQWEDLIKQGKGEAIYNTNIIQILSLSGKDKDGNSVWDRVAGVELDNPFNGQKILSVEGVFIEIGGVPGTELVQGLGAKIDNSGHVIVNDCLETNVPGLLAAGDLIDKSKVMKQVVTAMAFGAVAAAGAYRYVKGQKAPQILGCGQIS